MRAALAKTKDNQINVEGGSLASTFGLAASVGLASTIATLLEKVTKMLKVALTTQND